MILDKILESLVMVPKKSAKITVKLSPETKQDLQKEATQHDRTLSWVALKFIQDGIKRSKRKKEK